LSTKYSYLYQTILRPVEQYTSSHTPRKIY
jgi:hypothetical protein